jgi:hypothetical protein
MTIRMVNALPAVAGPPTRSGERRSRPARASTPAVERQSAPTANGRDLAALRWDLTIHELYRVFADYLEPLLDPVADGAPVRGESRVTDVRLTATRHALRDIEDALRRVEAGTYGVCDSCGRPIARQR